LEISAEKHTLTMVKNYKVNRMDCRGLFHNWKKFCPATITLIGYMKHITYEQLPKQFANMFSL